MKNGKMTDYESRTIEEWLEKIQEGKIALPSFQRDYVWKKDQVKKFLKALLTGRPVGALLTIRFANDPIAGKFKSRPFQDMEDGNPVLAECTDCEELVLDGQQRLTALWKALKAKEKYFVEIANWNDDELEIAPTDEPVRWEKDNANVAKDPFSAGEQNLIPISVLGMDGITQEKDALYKWCASLYGDDEDGREQARKLTKKIDESFVQKLKHRGLWYIQLPEDVERAEAIEIYINTNKSSSIIKPFDIAVAEFDRPRENFLRKRIQEWVEQMPWAKWASNSGSGEAIPEAGELILKIACLQVEKVPDGKNYASKPVIDHLQTQNTGLEKILEGLDWMYKLLEENYIFDSKHLPSIVPLRVVPALYPEFEKIRNSDHRGIAKSIISK